MAMKYFAFTVYEQAGEFEFSTRWVAAGNDATEKDIEASMEKTIFASVDPDLYPCCGDVQEITKRQFDVAIEIGVTAHVIGNP